MRLGIIGSGTIVQEFLPRIIKLEGLTIEGILGTKRSKEKTQALCEANGIPHAPDSLEELYALDIDTVYVAVPNHLHYTYCKQILEKGLHVIVEKPITSNLKEAEELKRIAVEKKLFLFEAITTLYLDNFHKLQEWLPCIGTVKLVQSQYSQYSRRYDAFQAGQVLPVFDSEKSGGALMDLNLYNLHLVMGLFGTPKGVSYHANIERGIDTSGVLFMEYDGFKAFCVAAKDCKGAIGAIIQGTKGCIRTASYPNVVGEVILELNDGTVKKYDNGSMEERVIPEFQCFIDTMKAENYSFCYEMLDKSIAVSAVSTEARKSAGIIFPADHAK